VTEYIPPATPEQAPRVASGLGQDRAVLLPNHGVMAVGENPRKAFHAAVSVEESARVAFIALQLGEPRQVSESEVRRMNDFIHKRYGQR
jgi:L-fuculose-phosphate aldolase